MVLVIAAYLAYQRHLRQQRENSQDNNDSVEKQPPQDDDDNESTTETEIDSTFTSNHHHHHHHHNNNYFNSTSRGGPLLEHHLHQAEQFRQTSSKFIQEAFVRCHPQHDPNATSFHTKFFSTTTPPPTTTTTEKEYPSSLSSTRSFRVNSFPPTKRRKRSRKHFKSKVRTMSSAAAPRMTTASMEQPSSEEDTDNHNNNTAVPVEEEQSIRQEWVNAVFGTDFYPSSFRHDDYLPPRQGTGLSQIPHYVTYPATIPPFNEDKEEEEEKEEKKQEVCEQPPQQKLGMTLSRLALGLYVKRIEPTSEAYSAGVMEGSILVDINGMGMLAEPSRQALERLWQYEGHFIDRTAANDDYSVHSEADATLADSAATTTTTTTTPSSTSVFPQKPLALRFYKNGKLYTCMFFSTPPFGISWAPCGNFALVQRASGKAQAAGIRKGCLLAAVNSTSLRDMDHMVAAKCLKEHVDSNQEITIRLAFTPAPSRCSHYQTTSNTNEQQNSTAKDDSTTNGGFSSPGKSSQQQPRKKPTLSKDGVEVRVHPLDESIGAMLSYTGAMIRGGPTPDKNGSTSNNDPSSHPQKPHVSIPQGYDSSAASEMAEQVAAGQLEAPTGIRSNRRRRSKSSSINSVTSTTTKYVRPVIAYEPCPELSNKEAFFKWDTMDALSYCVRFCQVGYDDEAFIQTEQHLQRRQHISTVFQQLWQRDESTQIIGAFLLQFVSVLCLPATITDETELQTATSHGTHVIVFLVELARRNNAFCHVLYFLLRSFVSTMETLKSNQQENNTHNLLSILQSLDLLHSAQDQLLEHLTLATKENEPTSTEPLSPEFKKKSADSAPTTTAADPLSPGNVMLSKKKKPKSVLGMFRKKSNSSKNQKHIDENDMSNVSTTPTKAVRSPRKSPNRMNTTPLGVSTPTPMTTTPVGVSTPIPNNNNNDQSTVIMTTDSNTLAVPDLFHNMSRFLDELDGICDTIEKSLLKSISQKIADWALQPWSPSKETTLARVTDGMRNGLQRTFGGDDKEGNRLPLTNPIESTETLLSVDSKECYVLPSAHFPLLLTFNISEMGASSSSSMTVGGERDKVQREEKLYRTRVEIVSLKGSAPLNNDRTSIGTHSSSPFMDRSFSVQGAVSGIIKESHRSMADESSPKSHRWDRGNTLVFDTRSTWGAPRTLSLRLAATNIGEDGNDQVAYTDAKGRQHYSSEVGFCWVDLRPMWQQLEESTTKSSGSSSTKQSGGFATVTYRAKLLSPKDDESFDESGELDSGCSDNATEDLELELRVTTEALDFGEAASGFKSRKRMLLYKHDDDIRQEMFAIQFINTCDDLLKASGLDLKLLTFRCMPVGAKRGFIEWVPGSVPLSEICQPVGNYADDTNSERSEPEPSTFADPEADEEDGGGGRSDNSDDDDDDDAQTTSELNRAGLKKYESLRHKCNNDSNVEKGPRGSLGNNPIQEFLRSTAYDADAPYLIQKEAMDTYVKSCAGFCVLTYLLGVGDRHLDNLLLHQSGHFFHCDFSFILGNDPKKYLPMRITEDMVHGMGGKESDNYAKFLSLAGAAFVTLRRHENVRVLLSLIRLLAPSALPDVSIHQNAEDVFLGLRDRLRLDLHDSHAISFIEELIENSISSKMWLAVDAIHSLGKRF